MILPFLILQLAVVIFANPFHKYPYVFLLDVGNEEIEKGNTEQIRLSIPGGSLAVKYPATGEGDLIGHVRVSGVDFGTDLKASIIQGGPGYKYVVLVFMGNPGVAYDAVVTIQTIPDDSDQIVNMDDQSQENDLNNSAEENDTDYQNINSINEKMQSSSNIIYKYSNEQFDSHNEDEGDDDYNDETLNSIDDESVINQDNEIEDEDVSQNIASNDNAIDLSENHVYSLTNDNYGKYEAFKPLIIGGVRFYPQSALYTQDYKNDKPTYDQEGHADDGSAKYKDSNNNDSDGSLVDY